MMVEAGANEVPEETILDAIMFAHEEIKKIVEFIEEIVKEVIDVFASFSETADPDEERSWVSENPFADENKPAEE